MRSEAYSLGSRLIACIAILASSGLLSACIAEPAGTVVLGLNESNRDVIVASSQHQVAPRVLTAHTWGRLFDDYRRPSGEITVFDTDCHPLATLPLTRAIDTLRIGPQNEIAFIGRGDNILPSGIHQAPPNPNGGGTLWAEATCP